MSVMVQSRGREPVPTWIFAPLVHSWRSLLRRFTNIALHHPCETTIHPSPSSSTAESLETGEQDRSQWSGSLLISFTEPRFAWWGGRWVADLRLSETAQY